MSEQEYNGWTNYETWNVALWLDNDQGSYGYWRERAEEAIDDAEGDKDEATSVLASQLSDEVEGNAPDLGSSCYADMLNAALGEVNWYEIAGHYCDEAKEAWDEAHAEEEPEEA